MAFEKILQRETKCSNNYNYSYQFNQMFAFDETLQHETKQNAT